MLGSLRGFRPIKFTAALAVLYSTVLRGTTGRVKVSQAAGATDA